MARIAFLAVLVPIQILGTVVFLGVDVDGHVFPHLGFGFATDYGTLVLKLGATLDGNTWVLEFAPEYSVEFGGFRTGLSANAIAVLNSEESGFILLVGPLFGYAFDLDTHYMEVSARVYLAVPAGVVKEFKGPVPFLSLSFGLGDI